MKKRVLAWILLAGFVLLLLNIVVFQIFLMQSIAVYAVIAVWFIFTNKPLPSNKIIKTGENTAGDFQGADNENPDEAESSQENEDNSEE
ncbi:hypothetical protein [Ruminiclostridium cellobioparum]|uniref:hypothetical protein n=1 Tax=Ruminiclostridium cellobioparum TaxID=29355 RepID=UPI0005579F12|nr:hypothetical protein [Ruminiclostridium cellobioparum]